ncbi:hypothetical protein FBZ84_103440 [Azospirillum baldaniorum]|uniref:hypothetical protein n=1 Tax=Azospirillum baldaniorum TaxID=1064539 RepID=UPI0011ADE732|nr:hypothetical protein [Azospirillum baldaniorum]TWA69723.1 hypothetical protein FBZ84_103440 [Azospirillum baldaniorum]
MASRNKLLSKTDYAAQIGVNKSQISRYCARGMPSHAGMIDPEEADWWREQNLDQTKPRAKVTPPQQRKAAISAEAAKVDQAAELTAKPARAESAPPTSPPADDLSGATVTFADGTSMDLAQIGDLNTVNRIDKFWAGELKRREAMAHDRQHIPRGEVEAAWDTANTLYRQGLDGVAGRTAGKLAELTGGDAAVIEGLIRDEHRTALAAVAKAFERAAVLAERGGAAAPGGGNDPAAEEAVD